jgi:hypothetical protein
VRSIKSGPAAVPNAIGLRSITCPRNALTDVAKSPQTGTFVRAVHDRLAAHFNV